MSYQTDMAKIQGTVIIFAILYAVAGIITLFVLFFTSILTFYFRYIESGKGTCIIFALLAFLFIMYGPLIHIFCKTVKKNF